MGSAPRHGRAASARHAHRNVYPRGQLWGPSHQGTQILQSQGRKRVRRSHHVVECDDQTEEEDGNVEGTVKAPDRPQVQLSRANTFAIRGEEERSQFFSQQLRTATPKVAPTSKTNLPSTTTDLVNAAAAAGIVTGTVGPFQRRHGVLDNSAAIGRGGTTNDYAHTIATARNMNPMVAVRPLQQHRLATFAPTSSNHGLGQNSSVMTPATKTHHAPHNPLRHAAGGGGAASTAGYSSNTAVSTTTASAAGRSQAALRSRLSASSRHHVMSLRHELHLRASSNPNKL